MCKTDDTEVTCFVNQSAHQRYLERLNVPITNHIIRRDVKYVGIYSEVNILMR
jgi:hypothetical protein